MKSIFELKKGDRFIAKVLDITPDSLVLELNGGFRLKARSLVLPDARIGENAVFSVKENINGQLQLEVYNGSAGEGDDIATIRAKRRSFDLRV